MSEKTIFIWDSTCKKYRMPIPHDSIVPITKKEWNRPFPSITEKTEIKELSLPPVGHSDWKFLYHPVVQQTYNDLEEHVREDFHPIKPETKPYYIRISENLSQQLVFIHVELLNNTFSTPYGKRRLRYRVPIYLPYFYSLLKGKIK